MRIFHKSNIIAITLIFNIKTRKYISLTFMNADFSSINCGAQYGYNNISLKTRAVN